MADNFLRPAFTRGVQMNGGLTDTCTIWHSSGTASIRLTCRQPRSTSNVLIVGSIVAGTSSGRYSSGAGTKTVNMYDDYFAQKKLRIRLGTAFTRSREDRSQISTLRVPRMWPSRIRTACLPFRPVPLPGVTVDKALYKMWAIDWGVKYNGLAINGQYYMRWLSDFEADGPMPVDSTFDHGFEMTVGQLSFRRSSTPTSVDRWCSGSSAILTNMRAASNGISSRPNAYGCRPR